MFKSAVIRQNDNNAMYTDVVFDKPFNHECLFISFMDDVNFGEEPKNIGVDSAFITKNGFKACHSKNIRNFFYLAIGY